MGAGHVFVGVFCDGTQISAVEIDPASPAFTEPAMAEEG